MHRYWRGTGAADLDRNAHYLANPGANLTASFVAHSTSERRIN
jgi:hypothetical protein